MANRFRGISWVVISALGIALATAGLARSLERLPADFVFPQGAGSPGKVTFSHLSHVDQSKPNCTGCHPASFKMLEKGVPAEGETISHAEMQKGRQCGACHDGQGAFGLDNCLVCHRQG